MDAALVATIIIGAVTFAGVIIGLLAYRKQNPLRVVQYGFRFSRLVQDRSALSSRMKVLFDGIEVSDPHLVEVTIRNTGRTDIRTSDFDAGRSIRFEWTPKMTVFPVDFENDIWELGEDYLLLKPMHIPQKSPLLRISILCSGRPAVKLKTPAPLINTKIEQLDPLNFPSKTKKMLTEPPQTILVATCGVIAIVMLLLPWLTQL